MKRTETVIIGAGQAGLSLSNRLAARGVEHAVIERGRVAQRWSERWDSLRLLSPKWSNSLPGAPAPSGDPDGFMTRDEVSAWLRDYARAFAAPVVEETEVTRVAPADGAWSVETSRGSWHARTVAIATGHCQTPRVPPCAADAPPEILQVTTASYRNPAQLPPGGVLVVGASASGVQLARELRASGRDVVLAVGKHTRLPRRYRGRDIYHWLDRIGAFERPLSAMDDAREATAEESLQLVGSDSGETLDLEVLAREGVRLAGRLTGFRGGTARFAGDLSLSVTAANLQMLRLFVRIDRHIESHGLDAMVARREPVAAVPLRGEVRELPLRAAGISSILWATGYRREYPWLHAPVLDERGEIRHMRGRTPAAGLFVLGLQFMIRRSSSFLHGIGHDAEEIAAEIAAYLGRIREVAA